MHPLHLHLDCNLWDPYIPSICIAKGIVSAIDSPNHRFTVSLTQTIARDTPPGTLTMHAMSLALPFEPPPLNENIAFSGELLTVVRGQPIFKLIQFDTVVDNVPEP